MRIRILFISKSVIIYLFSENEKNISVRKNNNKNKDYKDNNQILNLPYNNILLIKFNLTIRRIKIQFVILCGLIF